MKTLINTEVLPFNAKAFHNGKFIDVSDADLKGKWSVVFFYPADFTFVCPTELGDLADNYKEFKKLGVEIYSVSTDTHFTHKAWHDTSDTIGKILAGGQAVCREAGIPIAGGHTIDSVEPIYGLVAMGLVHPKRVKRNADARVGDCLILGKPLGVGVLSAALKKDALGADGYAQMIANTTKLNTPGPELAAIDGVHALTDVTGFGLAGHALEMARGSGTTVQIDMARVPLIGGVRDLAAQGMVTGASGRNWAAYGSEVHLAGRLQPVDQALLTDPQTSGGLLVACAPESVQQVLDVFARHGFEAAAEVGEILPAEAGNVRLKVL